MKAIVFVVSAGLVLSACSNQTSNSDRGVGFSDYSQYELERARREAALTASINSNTSAVQSTPVVQGTAATNQTQVISSDELASIGIGTNQSSGVVPQTATGALQNTSVDSGLTQGLDATPTNAAPALANNTGISDEQDFDAVANRESIESDAQRRAAQAAARQEIAPTAVPERPADTGPNIVEYAINAPNNKGQEWYSRSLLSGEGRFQRNCARYGNADDAQRDFLSRGGPERDRLGIDPDGDGFACGWDPAPFR